MVTLIVTDPSKTIRIHSTLRVLRDLKKITELARKGSQYDIPVK